MHGRGIRRGPVGLLAAYSALFNGAAEVYVVDGVAERLDKAGELGAIPVDYRTGDPSSRSANYAGKRGCRSTRTP